MRCFAAIGVSLAAMVPLAYLAEPDGELRARDLVGVYSIVSCENGGKAVPAEKIDGVIVRFTEDKIVTTDTDKKRDLLGDL